VAIGNIVEVISLLTAVSGSLAAVIGIVVLEVFFRNKLKALFEDVNYFIFFFMVSGYILYALGEVSYYLSKKVLNDVSLVGIQDVYWTGGGVLILVSFIALAVTLFKQHGGTAKFGTMAGIGAVLVVLVLGMLFGTGKSQPGYLFGYLYPLISSLIVTFASSVILFYNQLGSIARPLVLFLLSSGLILIGDIFFHYTYQSGGLTFGADIFYCLGYFLSAAAFLYFRISLHKAALEVR